MKLRLSSVLMVIQYFECRAARGKGAFEAVQAAGASGRYFLVDFYLCFSSVPHTSM